MKLILKTCMLVLLATLTGPPAQASNEIHYIGFNRFVAGQEGASSRAFNEYIRKLHPIMSRYGMTVQTFDVVHGGTEDLAADVVSFGSANDEESFQAFFEDPEFQQIFPILIGALSDHQVIFTSGPFSIAGEKRGQLLLSLEWVEGQAAAGVAKLRDLNGQPSAVFDTYGVREIAHTAGVMSSRGLAGEITPTVPPHLLELWAIDDPHGFLDDPLVRSASVEAEGLLSRKESFWLRLRDIR